MPTSTLPDLVKVVSQTVGTAPFTLGAAVEGYFGVEKLTDGATYSYSVQQDGNIEYGRGTFTAATNQMTRGVIGSSNANNPVPFSVGAHVSFVMLAEDLDERVGIAANFTIGSVNPGPTPAVTLNGASPNFELDFVLQPGAPGSPGPANNLTIGTVSKIAAGGTPTANIHGAVPNQVLDLGIVTGDAGGSIVVGLFSALATTVVPVGTNLIRTAGFSQIGIGIGSYFYDPTVNSAYVAAHPLTSQLVPTDSSLAVTRGFRLDPTRVNPYQFGAIGNADLADGTFNPTPTDDSAAINAFLLFCSSQRLPGIPEMSGSFYILSPLVCNSNVPATFSNDATYSTAIKFHCRIRAGAAMDNMLTFSYFQALRASGMIHFYGTTSGSPFSVRNVNNALFLNYCVNSAFDMDIFGENLAYSVVETGYSPSNCNLVNIRHIAGKRVGSAPRNTTDTGFGQVATFGTRVDTGSANSFNQVTTITPTSLPPVYTDAPQRPVRLWINGYMYRMVAINRTTGTIGITPWLPQGVTTGSLEYNFGAVFVPRGTDSNLINVETISSQNSAGAAQLGCLYGGVLGTLHCEAGGIALGVGNDPSATMLGLFVGRLYCEGTRLDYYHALGTPTDLIIASASPFDWTKVQSASGTQNGVLTTNPVEVGLTGVTINGQSRMPTRVDLSAVSIDPSLIGMDGSVWNGPFASMTFNLLAPSAWPFSFFNKRGPTIYVAPAPSFSASGTPTTVTFNAPAGGWTVNGGASAIFTGFGGPASFRFYIDTVALTINIRCLTGRTPGGKPGIATKGDVAATLAVYTDESTQLFSTTLTANRAITLPTAGNKGAFFHIIRTGGGAFNLDVGGLKTLAVSGTFARVEDNGSAWVLTASGSIATPTALSAALPTDGSASNAAIATAINTIRTALITAGIGS